MYVCCAYTYLHAYIHNTCMPAYLPAYLPTHLPAYTHNTCMHVCIHTYTYIHRSIRPPVHTFIYPYMHVCMHTCTPKKKETNKLQQPSNFWTPNLCVVMLKSLGGDDFELSRRRLRFRVVGRLGFSLIYCLGCLVRFMV